MKITELPDKILIAELDPEKDYIMLVNPSNVDTQSLEYAKSESKRLKSIPVILTYDTEKSVKFVEIPKSTS